MQFTNLEDAARAILGMNGKKVAGRVVAVDWTLSKKDYDSRAQQVWAAITGSLCGVVKIISLAIFF